MWMRLVNLFIVIEWPPNNLEVYKLSQVKYTPLQLYTIVAANAPDQRGKTW